jgi:hypothetical protein
MPKNTLKQVKMVVLITLGYEIAPFDRRDQHALSTGCAKVYNIADAIRVFLAYIASSHPSGKAYADHALLLAIISNLISTLRKVHWLHRHSKRKGLTNEHDLQILTAGCDRAL